MTNSQLIIQSIEYNAKRLQNALLVILIIALIGVSVSLGYLKIFSTHQIDAFTVDTAERYATVLNQVRWLYQAEVIDREKNTGVNITGHQPTDVDIPLATVFSMMLGNSTQIPDLRSALYDEQSFLFKSPHSPQTDNFAKNAWVELAINPAQDYYAFVSIDGIESLRYASFSTTNTACNNCQEHAIDNDHAEIIEVTIPKVATAVSLNQIIGRSLAVVIVILLTSAIAILIIFKRLRANVIEVVSTNKELRQLIDHSKQTQAQLLDLSLTDALTGISNRRSFDRDLERQWHWSLHKKASLAVVMFDIDNFKAYNDNYGHPKGDEVLTDVAQAMNNSQLRPFDNICRYGGEEFVLILVETDSDGAQKVAQRIRKNIEDLNIKHEFSGGSSTLTISAGVGVIQPGPTNSYRELVELADQALYLAKQNGRNRVECLNLQRATI